VQRRSPKVTDGAAKVTDGAAKVTDGAAKVTEGHRRSPNLKTANLQKIKNN
jgi:X-X-X-Leu-X-X-Gly heptad repeat protein